MKHLRSFLRPQTNAMLASGLIGGLSSAMAVGLLGTSAWLISMASMRPPILVLEVAIVAVRFFGLSRGVLRYASRLIEHKAALTTISQLRIGIYSSLERRLAQYFALLSRGGLLRRLVSDTEVAQDLWLRLANPWLGAIVSGVSGLGIIQFLLPKLALVLTGIFALALFAVPVLALRWDTSQQNTEEAVFDSVVQACDSIQESLIFGYQENIRTEIDLAQSALRQIDVRSGISTGLAVFVHTVCVGASVAISAAMATNSFRNGDLAGVNVAVMILLPLVIFDGLTGLPAAFSRAGNIFASTKSIDGLLAPHDIQMNAMNNNFPLAHRYVINFENVVPLLEGMPLQPFSGIATNEIPLILRGKSGSGKSSLVHALVGFLEYEGSLTINGVEAATISSEERITHFSVLLQQDHLFSTSIRENMKIGNPAATDEMIMEAFVIVELDELISQVGLDTHIGPYGHNFSGGERQRIKLARSLLRPSEILILDEPFEYLDQAQISRIAKRVSEYAANKTLVVVSHLEFTLH